MTESGAEALRAQIRRLRERPGVEMGPATAYDAVTRQMVEALEADLQEIKGRLNGVLWMVAGTIVVDVVLRVMGS